MDNDYQKFINEKVEQCLKTDSFKPELFEQYDVKKGLRDKNGKGVIVGLTSISQVSGSIDMNGEKIPSPGKLCYRGYDIKDITKGFLNQRFGFAESAYLLLFGDMPNQDQLDEFKKYLNSVSDLPVSFVRDVVMKAASKDIMNSISRCILFLASYDDKSLDNSLDNVLRQCIYLISVFPMLTAYSYHAYNHYIND